jgi:hypothetical protein
MNVENIFFTIRASKPFLKGRFLSYKTNVKQNGKVGLCLSDSMQCHEDMQGSGSIAAIFKSRHWTKVGDRPTD